MYCPGVKENYQHIQRQEHESVEIVMEIKLDPGFPDGLHTAFEYGVLGWIGIVGNDFRVAENIGENDHYQAEEKDNYKK